MMCRDVVWYFLRCREARTTQDRNTKDPPGPKEEAPRSELRFADARLRYAPCGRVGVQFLQLVRCQICTAETLNSDTLRHISVQCVHNRTLAGHLDASFDLRTSATGPSRNAGWSHFWSHFPSCWEEVLWTVRVRGVQIWPLWGVPHVGSKRCPKPTKK